MIVDRCYTRCWMQLQVLIVALSSEAHRSTLDAILAFRVKHCSHNYYRLRRLSYEIRCCDVPLLCPLTLSGRRLFII